MTDNSLGDEAYLGLFRALWDELEAQPIGACALSRIRRLRFFFLKSPPRPAPRRPDSRLIYHERKRSVNHLTMRRMAVGES